MGEIDSAASIKLHLLCPDLRRLSPGERGYSVGCEAGSLRETALTASQKRRVRPNTHSGNCTQALQSVTAADCGRSEPRTGEYGGRLCLVLTTGFPAFVARLANEFESSGKNVWIDTAGIEDTEVFPLAIRSAIESSDAFLFVISPASVGSRFCEQEVDYALSLNKRLVPVLRSRCSTTSSQIRSASETGSPLRKKPTSTSSLAGVA